MVNERDTKKYYINCENALFYIKISKLLLNRLIVSISFCLVLTYSLRHFIVPFDQCPDFLALSIHLGRKGPHSLRYNHAFVLLPHSISMHLSGLSRMFPIVSP